MNELVSQVLGQKISKIMYFSFQIRSISNKSAKLHGLWEAKCALTNLN